LERPEENVLMFRTVVAPVSSQEAHIRRVDAQLDHRQDVAAFDRDFVRGDVGLRARSNWAEDAHESHPENNGEATHRHAE
jgi:hypothetical protein